MNDDNNKEKILEVRAFWDVPNNFSGIAKDYIGDLFWYKDGQIHRENNHAVEYKDGSKHWYKDGKFHRTDGPAIENVDGYSYWYIDGKRHRLDGPAIENSSGLKYWFIEDIGYSEEKYHKKNPRDELKKTRNFKS